MRRHQSRDTERILEAAANELASLGWELIQAVFLYEVTVWKEMVVAYTKLLSQNLAREINENGLQQVSQPRRSQSEPLHL